MSARMGPDSLLGVAHNVWWWNPKNDNASPWPGRAPRPKRVKYAARLMFAALMESYGLLPYL